MRRTLLVLVACLLVAAPAWAQKPHRAPPAHGKHKGKNKKKKHRAPPAPEPDMPVRKPQEVKRFKPTAGPPGERVKIRGKHFDTTTKVRFNGRWLRTLERKRSKLVVEIPNNATTDQFVVVKAGFPDVTSDDAFHVVRPPQIGRFAPRRGGSGTRVTITGNHFLPSDSVVIGDTPLRTIGLRDDRVVVKIPPSAATGRLGIQRDGRVVAWSGGPFHVIGPPPVVTAFNPTRGGPGTTVRIDGQHFEPSDRVLLAGRPAQIQSRSPHHFQVVVGGQPSGPFIVVGPNGRRAVSHDEFSILRPPVVRRFQPAFGGAGTRIVILGHGFFNGDAAYIGDAMLTVRTISDRRITAELPAGVTSGPISVVRDGRKYLARGRFEVIHEPSISSVEPRRTYPGATITIAGRHLIRGTDVLLSGHKLPIVGARLPNELQVRLPANARTGVLTVVNRGGTAKTPFPIVISRYAKLSSFFPLHGLPGATVTLRGQHFHREMEVFLGPLKLNVVSLAPNSAEVRIPAGARSARFKLVSHSRQIASRLPFKVDQPRPELSFTFAPTTARRGTEVTLLLDPPRQSVGVFYDGQPLPKRVLEGGRRLVVTVPGNARSGFFELELGGQRYRAAQRLRVR